MIKGSKMTKESREKMSKTRKGKHLSNTEFKKGITPWNKNTKGLMPIPRNKGIPCSKELREKLSICQRGNKSKNWKGGITSIGVTIRNSLEFKFWKRECLKRDNFTCQKTRIRGGVLNVHHIYNFADFPELRFDINNGITLSKESHKEFHHIYGKKNNTREQINEFLSN